MATTKLTKIPKAPDDFSKEMKGLWRDACARLIEAGGFMFRADVIMVDNYVRMCARMQQVQQEANNAPMYDDRGRLSEIFKLESELANKVKGAFRSIENTAHERMRESRIAQSNDSGGRPGVRQKPAREGVKANGPKPPSSVSWLDDARRKAAGE